jgi:hypothetical protein
MRSAMKSFAAVSVAVLGITALVAPVRGQAKPEARDSPAASGRCSPLRTILADGRIMVRNVDCTTNVTAKQESGKASPDNLEPLMPVAPETELADPAANQGYMNALKGYYQYRIEGYEHRRQVFAWQLFSSKVIFAVVLLLVCSGIYFAALQFHAGLKRQSEMHAAKRVSAAAYAGQQGTESVTDPEVTTLSMGTEGIKVSSPVLGVVILTISLAFFYLYLVYVYPISDLF